MKYAILEVMPGSKFHVVETGLTEKEALDKVAEYNGCALNLSSFQTTPDEDGMFHLSCEIANEMNGNV